MSISCIGRPRLEYSSGHPTGNPGGAEGDAVFAGLRRLCRRCSSDAYPPGIVRRWSVVTTLWPNELEVLEAIAENKDAPGSSSGWQRSPGRAALQASSQRWRSTA